MVPFRVAGFLVIWLRMKTTIDLPDDLVTEIKIEAEDYLILRESDVLAKVVESRKPVGAKA